MTRRRADLLLVDRGLFESRARAQAAIEAGLVTADGAPVRKAADRLAANVKLAAEAPHPWVSRGGVKLAAALDAFGLDPAGASASTSEPRPAASPKFCSRAALRKSTRSTSAAGSCTRGSPPTRG